MRWAASLVVVAACVPDAPAVAPHDQWDDKLAERVVDYNATLRIAALRLTGELPTISELEHVEGALDPAAAYDAQVRAYLASPRFARQMFHFWQDTLKLGDAPALDSAAAFVAQLAVDDRSFLDTFTATAGTCPTYDGTGFASGDCGNGGTTVGLLTHPGMNALFYSNFAFRRVRWLQETFECTKFPAELALTGTDVGGATPYTGMFPFESIASPATGGRVNFLDTTSVLCANCHSNLNHIAPVFAHYDRAGQYQPDIAVTTPLPDAPLAQLADYLPAGEPLAWRHDVPITDMASLGAAVAADPDTTQCVIARLWNWALGKSDIVDAAVRVPAEILQPHVDAFRASGFHVRDALHDIFTSDDFVRF
jgi:hypothetical protein